jgi:hypothetical protein
MVMTNCGRQSTPSTRVSPEGGFIKDDAANTPEEWVSLIAEATTHD